MDIMGGPAEPHLTIMKAYSTRVNSSRHFSRHISRKYVQQQRHRPRRQESVLLLALSQLDFWYRTLTNTGFLKCSFLLETCASHAG